MIAFVFTETCSPPSVASGTVNCNVDPATVGDVCNVICNDGYTPDQYTVACEAGDKWLPTPTCQGRQMIDE